MIGRTFSHYRILEQIGSGGMGEVYRARDERLERDVALKILPPGAVSDEGARKRFRREALALSRLNHPNIATVLDFDRQDDVDFLVMEYVAGEGVVEKVRGGPLAQKEIARLGLELAEGIAAVHGQGVIHRDLKPGNLRLMPDGRLKILDFGLAQLLEAAGAEGAGVTETASAIGAGVAVGTLPYMAPERLRGERADARSDIWAVGLVLYELATGRRAFPEGDTARIITAILHEAPSPASGVSRPISPALENIIAKCLEKDPENRYQSAKELAVDLRRLGATSHAVGPRSAGHARSRPWVAAGVGGLAVTIAASLFALNVGGLRHRLLSSGPPQIRSLAVLPLENLSRDPEQEYFTDGMTQELIANLGKIGALRVISRSSVMSLRRTRKPLPEIAKLLNVDAVVEGSAVRSGDRVRITAALVQAIPERQLWSDSYERDAEDVLALQAEIAGEIAQQIRVRLAPEERARLASRKPVNADAYEAYLRGRVYLERFDWGQNRKAIAMFQRAIEIQPTFALAWAGLADAHYAVSSVYVPPRNAMPKVREAARKALELDRNLSEAHAVMGVVASQFEWDWEGAEREYREAIRLNASNANAHLYYAFMLAGMGRMGPAIAEVIRARELNPLSASTASYVPVIYYWAGEYDSALVLSRRLTESEPEYWQHRGMLATSYIELRMHEEAIEEARKMVSLSGGSYGHGLLAVAYAHAGQRQEALAELSLTQRGDSLEGIYFEPTGAARVYARLGDKEHAFKWLNKAYEDRCEDLLYINVDPSFRILRSDPRFHDLVRRIGLAR